MPPSTWRAMKPWVISRRAGCCAKRSAKPASASRRQFTDSRVAHALWFGNAIAVSQSRASHQPKSKPCDARYAAPSVDDSSSPWASTSACQSSARPAARGSVTSACSEDRRSPSTATGSSSSSVQNARWRSTSAAMRVPMSSPAQIASSSLVTPDSAETTTSTRTPSSALRLPAMRPMVSQRLRRDTEVPPNLSTTHRVASATASVLVVVADPAVCRRRASHGITRPAVSATRLPAQAPANSGDFSRYDAAVRRTDSVPRRDPARWPHAGGHPRRR